MDNDTQLAVFDNETDNYSERGRSRALLLIGGIAALLMVSIVMILMFTKPASEREAENLVRAGSPEFDSYKDKVVLEIDPDSKLVHPNMIGMWQLAVTATLSNRGNRELKSVEVVGKMIDLQDKVIAQTISRPIPRIRSESLKPGESMTIKVKVDAPAKISEDDVKDILMELNGLRFQ